MAEPLLPKLEAAIEQAELSPAESEALLAAVRASAGRPIGLAVWLRARDFFCDGLAARFVEERRQGARLERLRAKEEAAELRQALEQERSRTLGDRVRERMRRASR